MKSIYIIILFTLSSIILVQCKAEKEITKTEKHDHSSHSHGENSHHEHIYMAKSTEADTMNTNGFNVIYYTYFKLRDALSVDNKTKAADYAGSMYRAISKLKTTEFTVKEKNTWQARASLIKESAMQIANSADKLDVQRTYISQLSLNLMELMKTSKLDNPVYLLHCTKSNNNKGGNWLSLENNTNKNPYQNNSPEPCGFLIEIIK